MLCSLRGETAGPSYRNVCCGALHYLDDFLSLLLSHHHPSRILKTTQRPNLCFGGLLAHRTTSLSLLFLETALAVKCLVATAMQRNSPSIGIRYRFLNIRFLKQVNRYFRLPPARFLPARPDPLNIRNEYTVRFKYTVSLHMCGGIYLKLVLSSNALSIMWRPYLVSST